MDIEDIFSNQAKNTVKSENTEIKFAVLDSLIADPIIHGLDQKYEIIRTNPLNCAKRLKEGMVSSALIDTLDYAKGKGSWKLIPDFCIASKGQFKTINLFFNKEIRDLKSVAINADDPTAKALLKIIMQEKYEISPDIKIIKGDLAEKLNKADAALISGNTAFILQQSNKMFIDLVDEWCDLTGLPFVYGLWTVHEMGLSQKPIDALRTLMEINIKNQAGALKSAFKKYGDNEPVYADFVNTSITYRLGMEEKDAINEFFRYAFFFGMIEHIPDLHFIN